MDDLAKFSYGRGGRGRTYENDRVRTCCLTTWRLPCNVLNGGHGGSQTHDPMRAKHVFSH